MANRSRILLSAFILLTGCVQREVIDDVRLITGLGYDAREGSKVEGTALIPYHLPDQKVENTTLSAISSPSRNIFRIFQKKSQDPIVTGATEVVLFGRDLAEKGISPTLDSLERDPAIGTNNYFAVVDGKAKDILQGDYGKKGNSAYIADLIKQNTKNLDLPKTNMHTFLADFYMVGKSPYLPFIKKNGNKGVELIGLALFKNDKVIDILPPNKLFYFKLMVERYTHGGVRVAMGKNEAVVRSINSKLKPKLTGRNPYELTINVEVEGLLEQYTGGPLNKKIRKQIDAALKKQIETTCMELFKRYQEKDIDPIGLGAFVRSRTRNFDQQKWRKTDYPNMQVHVNAKVKLLESGVVE
ncbi:Ger(x)C family spore germination protein [Bacillus sp. EB01]|uniref:Ger(x)C family spore germination protein n=1 Tax=Bacillus sp. EB01 TaxID=1347086 RepID=UPI0005C6D226|nr:Ger(x)C family spore germination protein [Bacillus sp. EB01]